MKKLLSLLLLLPLFLMAQGIKFEEGLSWDQIKAKAKAEDKFIFIDCYATWCKPCKQMDKQVYIKDSVGNFMNGKFISLKIQIDSTKNDNDRTKSLYALANFLLVQYRITGFPTYLLFSPQGKVLNKDMGKKS